MSGSLTTNHFGHFISPRNELILIYGPLDSISLTHRKLNPSRERWRKRVKETLQMVSCSRQEKDDGEEEIVVTF